MYKVYLGVELGDSFGALLFCQNKNRLDMKSTECNPGGAEKARDRPDPEGGFNVGLWSKGVERGGNDARLNKLQSKGNVFKCSTWNYRGSNTERRSESEIHWEWTATLRTENMLSDGYSDEFRSDTKQNVKRSKHALHNVMHKVYGIKNYCRYMLNLGR